MAFLRFKQKDREQRIDVLSEQSMLDALSETGIDIPNSCGGTGRCGLCQVRIEDGHASPLTDEEHALLPPYQIRRQIRLACQARPVGDVVIALSHDIHEFKWHTFAPEEYYETKGSRSSPSRLGYGIAVDLGSTQIRLSFWDLSKNERLAGLTGFNLDAPLDNLESVLFDLLIKKKGAR